jgi:CP family cyanate transporter-like MFS transporter
MDRIVEDLSLSRASAGLITTIPVLLMGFLAPLAPILARRWSQERVLKGTMALLVVAFAIRYFSQYSFTLLLVSALVAGIGIAIAGPLMSGFIKQYFSRHITLAITVYSVSVCVGASLAVALTTPIIQMTNNHWEHGLAVWGLLALAAFCVLLIYMPKASITNKPEYTQQKLPLHSFRAWLLTCFFAAQSGVFYALSTWLVSHLQQAGFDNINASMLASAFMASGIIGAFALPLLAARVANHNILIAAVTLSSTFLILCIAWQPQWHPILIVSLLGITTSGTFALALALPVMESDSPQSASQLSSMMSSFGYIVGGVTPSLVGIGRDITHSFEWPMTFLSILSFSMVIIALFLRNKPND